MRADEGCVLCRADRRGRPGPCGCPISEFLDGNKIAIMPSTGRYFQVPFRITVPKNVENLLDAERCVAGDKVSHAATRQTMCCTVRGQGAGVASAVSLEAEVPSHEVDIGAVQDALRRQGVRLT